jgi:hypothetical protein
VKAFSIVDRLISIAKLAVAIPACASGGWAASGGSTSSGSIDGGYEVNGELSFDLVRRTPEAIDQRACIGWCRCDIPYLRSIWTCYDDSYRVGVTARDGYQEVARIEPTFWLGRSRALILSRRPE